MNLTENILISNILIVSSLQLFVINMTVYVGLPTKDEQIQLEGYSLESPYLKRSIHAQFFGILKKLTFLQEELFLHFFRMQYLVILLLK